MAALPVSEDHQPLTVSSHRGPYTVHFGSAAQEVADDVKGRAFFLVDETIVRLFPELIDAVSAEGRMLTIRATEPNKNLDKIPALAEELLRRGLRRDTALVAIGGGITQDVACFLASVLMRGVRWKFYPTTLLAQADSCIGSKSSINVGSVKNSAGTFWPPSSVVIDRSFLTTLSDVEMRSGMGEMIKVHIIEGPEAFDRFATDYDRLSTDAATLQDAIRRSLEIKRRIIEVDEFDAGPRQVLNYGHTFGHAIESATAYGIPHGIAVTIGIDMANFIAVELGRLDARRRARMKAITDRNARGYERTGIPFDAFESAIKGDKKVSSAGITAILPNAGGVPERVRLPLDDRFLELCRRYLTAERGL